MTGLSLFSLFQTSLKDLRRAEKQIAFEFHMQPSEINALPFAEVEEYIEFIIERNKAKEKEEKAMSDRTNNAKTNYKAPKAPKFNR